MVDSDEDFGNKYSWMVRPCHIYDDEYSDCTSLRSRLHQNFIFGSYADCSQWKRDSRNCAKWTESHDINALKELVNSEMNRREERLAGHLKNDVWEKRSEPPSNWNDPLPKHIVEKMEHSYLTVKAQELKENSSSSGSSICILS